MFPTANRGGAALHGVVPVDCARLPGAQDLVLGGVAHSRKIGRDWYGGSKAIMRRWWPADQNHES